MKSATMIGAVLLAASLAQAEESHWLNVRDCGASGSRFETTAATVASSKKITVKSVGDFKVGQGVMVSRRNIRYVNSTL